MQKAIKIGNTPIVELKNLQKKYGVSARIFAKLEKENEGGSIKDRVAQAIIDDAERQGKLKKGGVVVEATSGNTGIGLALVASARGYKAVIVMPETMSVERQKMLRDYGAELILTEGSKGMLGAVEKANEIVRTTPNCILADQFNNPVCALAHYQTTGVELYSQMQGEVDIFVACVGTGGTISGIGKYLKEKNPKTRVIAVEPSRSPLLSKGVAGAHGIQGIGANFIPSVLDRTVYDEVYAVSDEEAFAVARELNGEENLGVGISSGAAVAACLAIAKREENAGKRIATILPDDINRYLSVL